MIFPDPAPPEYPEWLPCPNPMCHRLKGACPTCGGLGMVTENDFDAYMEAHQIENFRVLLDLPEVILP